MAIDNDIFNLVDRLVSVSDFSKGKTAKIFDDIKNNKKEYIVLKNNQPTAVLISIDEYADMATKAKKLEDLLERIEENRLLKKAIKISEGYDPQTADSYDAVLSELGIGTDEIDHLVDNVAIE